MVLESNRDLVLRRLTECLGRDRTKHQVTEITSLGLVQMTRKRIGQGLLEAFSETCEHCNGRGVIVHTEPVGGGGNGAGGGWRPAGRRQRWWERRRNGVATAGRAHRDVAKDRRGAPRRTPAEAPRRGRSGDGEATEGGRSGGRRNRGRRNRGPVR